MRTSHRGSSILSLCCWVTLTGRSLSESAVRQYAPGAWSTGLYDSRLPESHTIVGVGLVNEEEVYVAGTAGIYSFHSGYLTQIEAVNGEITAFQLCHHRSSIFYEVLSPEGGDHSIFEYSLISKTKNAVRHFQDKPSATSLACVDRYLLRTSAENLLMIPLTEQVGVHVLHEFHGDSISSLSVRFAADVYWRAELYGVVPTNHSINRFQFYWDASKEPKVYSSETILAGGVGSDGAANSATVLEPHYVLCMRDSRLVFVDGCSVRELRDGRVRTLVGVPAECEQPAKENLEPVPWSSRLSRLTALAGTADGTASVAMLLLTGAQIVDVSFGGEGGASGIDPKEAACAAHNAEAACTSDHGCGWAEGDAVGEKLCLSCDGLQRWASGHACDLEGMKKAGTRYALAGCGCVAPEPHPEPDPADGKHHNDGIWAILVVLTLLACLVGLLVLYRAHRRAAAVRQLYGGGYGDPIMIDTAEFHTFTDDDCPHR